MAGFFNPSVEAENPEELNPLAEIVAPKMVTSLVLDQDQESAFASKILKRIDELRSEMGAQWADGGQEPTGWMLERYRNQLQYDGDYSWREGVHGGIFQFSNFSLNLPKRYVRLLAAKASDDLVGTDPYFSIMPHNSSETGDPTLAKESEGYIQDQISESNLKRTIKGAQKTALIRNECVVKLSYVTNDTHFRGPGIVAVGPFRYTGPKGDVVFGAGQPVMTPKGEYIYQNDNVFPDPNTKGLLRLEKETGVAFRYALAFQYFEGLDQTLHGYTGLDGRELDYRDFLCPLNVASIHEADICVHLFNETWERMKAQYNGFPVSAKYVNQPFVSGAKQPRLEKNEEEVSTQSLNIVYCADVYIRCNPFEDGPNDLGQESEIWAVMDLNSKTLIWYDFLGSHMGKRPFEVIPGVEHVQNRWYGVGVYEMLASKHLYIETQFNRINWKSMKSSSLRFRMKNAVAQWKAGEEVVMGDDTVYDIEDSRFDSNNPPFFEVNPREIDEYAFKLLELEVQASSTEVGIVGPDDGAMAGLDTTKLATGIKSLERTGNLLMKCTETDQGEAIADILDQAVEIVLEHMDTDQLIYKPETGSLVNLNRDEIRKFRNTATLLLTRSRSTELIELSRMVIQTCREFMEALTPVEQWKFRPEYLRILRSLEVPNGEELLPEVTKEQALAWQQQQANTPPPLPPKTSIATKYPDLARSEQTQVLAREGITPASDEEISKAKKEEVKQEGDLAGAEAEAKAEFAPKPKPASGSKSKAS